MKKPAFALLTVFRFEELLIKKPPQQTGNIVLAQSLLTLFPGAAGKQLRHRSAAIKPTEKSVFRNSNLDITAIDEIL